MRIAFPVIEPELLWVVPGRAGQKCQLVAAHIEAADSVPQGDEDIAVGFGNESGNQSGHSDAAEQLAGTVDLEDFLTR